MGRGTLGFIELSQNGVQRAAMENKKVEKMYANNLLGYLAQWTKCSFAYLCA